MTFATSIQTFTGTNTLQDSGNSAAGVDWERGVIWIGGNPNSKIARSLIATGAEQVFKAYSDLAVPAQETNPWLGRYGVDWDGNLWLKIGAGLARINGVAFILDSTWGAYSNLALFPPGLPYSTTSNNALGGPNIPIRTPNGQMFVLGLGIGGVGIGDFSGAYLTRPPYFGGLWFNWAGADTGMGCSGPDHSGLGYVVSQYPLPGPHPITVYKIQISDGGSWSPASYPAANSAVTNTTLVTLNPTDVDAAWSDIQIRGVCLDKTDENLLLVVGSSSGTNRCYVVKLNASTGAILWSTAIANAVDPGYQLALSRIDNQRLYLIAAGVIVTVNTDTGAISNQTTGVANLTINGGTCSDDVTGCIALNCKLSATGPDSPALLNSSTINVDSWAALYVAPGNPTGTSGTGATSRKRAWTFVLDGHTFYVLDLGEEGTWLYDKTTQTWSQFYTLGYEQWDVANGTMWGTRIVGGDLATTDVWEVAASNLLDNGSLQIPHLVTGGVETRSRIYVSCNAVLLTVSLGDLDDTGGATMYLRFSDDKGQTWSDYFPMTMVEGDYDDELRWIGMGSFMSPGRIFEFSDVGGPRSIDACDAFIPDFDEQPG
jgi:hypothetical protein